MSSIPEPSFTPGFQSLRSRYAILASFYIAIILAIPVWFKTTTIERLPLPRHEVVAWESKLPCPIRTLQSLTLYFPPKVIKSAEEHLVAEELQNALRAAGDGSIERQEDQKAVDDPAGEGKQNKSHSDSIVGESIPLEYAACIDWDIRVKSSTESRIVTGLHYEIEFIASNENDETLHSITSTSTGRKFTAALPKLLQPGNELTSAEISPILASYLAKLLQLPYASLFYPSPHRIQSKSDAIRDIEQIQEDRRQAPYTRNLRLVFSLINEDISASSEATRRGIAGVRGWDGREVEQVFRRRFSPLLKALNGTQTFHRELQTIWFAPLQFHPKLLEVEREVSASNTSNTAEKDEAGEEVVIGETLAEEPIPRDTEDEEAVREEREVDNLDELIAAAGNESLVEEAAVDQAKKEVDQIHVIDWEDIKIFVNSGEWSLSSGAITSPLSSVNASGTIEGATSDMYELFEQAERTLHFIIYIPKPSHRPLRIAGDEQATKVSDAKGWLIPQWGGVSLFNLGYEDTGHESSVPAGSTMLGSLSAAEMDHAFATFEKQFNTLLGLQELEGVGDSISEDVKLALKLDALTRRRIMAACRESVKTLGSIIRLVDKIENLGVGQSVRDDVSRALLLLDGADQLTNTTSYQSSTTVLDLATLAPLQTLLDLVHSSELLSSRAFFNPNMLGQLYFPDEHKYAVYTPLFGPLAVPLLVAGVRLLKERRQKQAISKRAKMASAKAK